MSRFSRARNVKDPVAALAHAGDCGCMKKVKPPVAPVGCVEPYIKNTNTLRDPNFAFAGAGPSGNEIGAYQASNDIQDSDQNPIPPDNIGNYADQVFASTYWATGITTDPYTGSTHLESVSNGGGKVWPVGFKTCTNFFGADYYPAARANPGDLVTWTIWVKTTATPQTWLTNGFQILFYNDAGSSLGAPGTFVQTPSALTTSYTQYQMTAVAPPNSFYVFTACGWLNPFAGTIRIGYAEVVVT